MHLPPQGHVEVREDLLYFDGRTIHVAGGQSFELDPGDLAILDCVYRGESEFGLLCQMLGGLELGADTQVLADRLRAVFSDPRSLLELRPARYLERPDVIVCDFNMHSTPVPGRELVRRLRERWRVLFLGLEQRVSGSSSDSHWYSSKQKAPSRGFPSLFRYLQWARSIIRFHDEAVLVLLGHHDAVLFGDLAARLATVLVLDPGWPSGTGLGDLRGQHWLPDDLITNLRSVYYSIRTIPLDDFPQLNRHSSSSFAGMEAYAIRHADRVAYSLADQVGELVGMGLAPEQLLPVCLPVRVKPSGESNARTLILVADAECGLDPLGPFLSLLFTTPRDERAFDRVMLATGASWFEIVDTPTGGTLSPMEPKSSSNGFAAAFVFPGLLRDVKLAVKWMTSTTPVQLIPSSGPHPLQQDLDEVLLLRRITSATVHERLLAVADAGGDLRRSVLGAQARLARQWSIVRAIDGMVRASATAS